MNEPEPEHTVHPPALHRVAALLVMAGTIALDQVSKVVARVLLEEGHRLSFLGDVFRLELVRNAGAFLSLGEGLPPVLRTVLLTWGVLVVALGAAWVALFRPGTAALSAGAALVAGGGLGNFWDRVADHGLVTDFMNLGLGRLRTGVFNVADLAIVAGLVLLVLPPRAARRPSEER